MRPTFSIICFTVLSGMGYGAWFLVGLALATRWPCGPGWRANAATGMVNLCINPKVLIFGLLIGFLFVSAGLLASLGHLGKPLRAWRALSQWRSSWLSREGVFALATFVPATLLAIEPFAAVYWISANPSGRLEQTLGTWQDGTNWLVFLQPMLGASLALGALLTVYCTANIYSSLKTVRAWRDRLVVPTYLALGLYGGGLLLRAVENLPGWRMEHVYRQVLTISVLVFAVFCAWLKHRYWRAIDALPAPDAGHATGLSAFGEVRSFEAPHTEENYLTHEMGFVLARKHARKLRRIALISGFFAPATLALFALVVPALATPAAWLALASGLAGLFVERWLFFAEAKHAVMAYYAR